MGSGAADRDDEAGFLGDRQELVRCEQSAHRVGPPQERLHADAHPGLKLDDRLVEESELVVLDRALQRIFERETCERSSTEADVEPLETISTAFFRVIHRRVGIS